LRKRFAGRRRFPIFFLTLNPVKTIPIIIAMLAAAFAPLSLVSFPEAETVAAAKNAAPRVGRARIVAAGDLMQHMPQVSAARRSDGRYDYRESFRHVPRYFREADLAIGNIVGSNIFNILFVLGTSALISPIAFDTNWVTGFMIDAVMAIFAAVVLFLCIFLNKDKKLKRAGGITMLLIYAGYFAWIVAKDIKF